MEKYSEIRITFKPFELYEWLRLPSLFHMYCFVLGVLSHFVVWSRMISYLEETFPLLLLLLPLHTHLLTGFTIELLLPLTLLNFKDIDHLSLSAALISFIIALVFNGFPNACGAGQP